VCLGKKINTLPLVKKLFFIFFSFCEVGDDKVDSFDTASGLHDGPCLCGRLCCCAQLPAVSMHNICHVIINVANINVRQCPYHVIGFKILTLVYLFCLSGSLYMTRALPSVLNAIYLPIEYVQNVLNTYHAPSSFRGAGIGSQHVAGKGRTAVWMLGALPKEAFLLQLDETCMVKVIRDFLPADDAERLLQEVLLCIARHANQRILTSGYLNVSRFHCSAQHKCGTLEVESVQSILMTLPEIIFFQVRTSHFFQVRTCYGDVTMMYCLVYISDILYY
jgi:hypothetical protein